MLIDSMLFQQLTSIDRLKEVQNTHHLKLENIYWMIQVVNKESKRNYYFLKGYQSNPSNLQFCIFEFRK